MPRSLPSRVYLSTTTASRAEWRAAIAFLAVSLVICAAVIPFVRVPLAGVPGFIPAYESALFISDLITAVLLLGQFMQLRSRGLLVLAAGYFFDALIIIPHSLTFPGAFTPTGMLGAGPQTTAWLYVLWHGGFPLFIIGYVVTRRHPQVAEMREDVPTWVVAAALFAVVAVVVAITVLTTAGEGLLPTVMDGNSNLLLVTGIGPATWAISFVALVALWRRNATVLDLCLMVVMGAWLMDIALSALINAGRFDLGFYAGRMYGLLAASVVLIALLLATARERRAIADQLVQTQKMEAVGQLTGGIAHDFNNLLAGVIGNLEVGIDLAADRPDLKAALEDALDSALRGADLVKRLLTFSRNQPLRIRSIDLATATEKIAPLLRSSLGEQVTLDVVVPEGAWPARADPAELENSLLNLCINARDAMTGGGQITIEVSNFTLEKWFAKLYADLALGEYVVVSVSDTGAGMAPDVIARAFEPFFTTKETGKGSGLGLSMVHGYMRQSGGTVKIYSELGIGTTVSLYFPRGTVEGAVAQPAAKPAEIPGGSERILVVEDNPAVRKVAANILQSLGYRIAEAESAPAALSMLGKQSFDLVFSDIVMPKMNGIMLAEVLRRTYPAVAVLLTSGFSSKLTSANEIQRLGVNFVEKPYRKARLAQAVRAALGGAHAAG
jgi:signal transduction histidine kinase/ActR/RegA family two-component response regulator